MNASLGGKKEDDIIALKVIEYKGNDQHSLYFPFNFASTIQ